MPKKAFRAAVEAGSDGVDFSRERANAALFATRVMVDPDQLLAEYDELVQRIPATVYNNMKDGNRIGWALTSRTGKTDDIHGRRRVSYQNETEFDKPTKALRGYFKVVLADLSKLLGTIYRARIITIDGYREILPHHDGHDGTRFYRYHIPIIPNDRCLFFSADKAFIMHEAGRLYRFPAWHSHAVINHPGLRAHLMFSAYGSADELMDPPH